MIWYDINNIIVAQNILCLEKQWINEQNQSVLSDRLFCNRIHLGCFFAKTSTTSSTSTCISWWTNNKSRAFRRSWPMEIRCTHNKVEGRVRSLNCGTAHRCQQGDTYKVVLTFGKRLVQLIILECVSVAEIIDTLFLSATSSQWTFPYMNSWRAVLGEGKSRMWNSTKSDCSSVEMCSMSSQQAVRMILSPLLN